MAYIPDDTDYNPDFQTPSNNQNLEKLLDLIAEALIQDELVNTATVEENQKFISNGRLKVGGGTGVLALFQKDIKANEEDLNNSIAIDDDNDDNTPDVLQSLQEIANNIDFASLTISITDGPEIGLTGGGSAYNGRDITPLLFVDGTNPLNVSQFIPLIQSGSVVDVGKAEEFLDTNIYELLPESDTRQARIIRFFQELNALLPPNSPEFDLFDSEGNAISDNRVDRNSLGNWIGAEQYSQDNSISYAQDNTDGNIDEEDAFIHRLKIGSGEVDPNSTNSTRTIEDIYNTIEPYLRDILEDPILPQDDRPEYRNQSSGYLKFRNPNQGIVVRNTNQDFIEGLNPDNPTYLQDGFTITMWVRFLDKVSEGTLFNFGNPTRGENPFGFKLETYVLNKDDDCPHSQYSTWGDAVVDNDYNTNAFDNSTTARFVRLVINNNGQLRDSHVGAESINNPNLKRFDKLNTVIPFLDYDLMDTPDNGSRLINTTFMPEDFNEWYFICASFNPTIEEDLSHDSELGNSILQVTPNYWLNHIVPSTDATAEFFYTNNSGYGNQCKVEIISRSDLLRARGFKVD